jgi:hypothetical protein
VFNLGFYSFILTFSDRIWFGSVLGIAIAKR